VVAFAYPYSTRDGISFVAKFDIGRSATLVDLVFELSAGDIVGGVSSLVQALVADLLTLIAIHGVLGFIGQIVQSHTVSFHRKRLEANLLTPSPCHLFRRCDTEMSRFSENAHKVAARARAQGSLIMVVSGAMESPGRWDEECQADQQPREQEAGGDVDGLRTVGPHLVPRWGHRPESGETSRHGGQDDGAEAEIDERAGRRGDGCQEASEQHPIAAGGMSVPALPIDPPLGDRPSPPPCVARVRSLHLSGRNDGSRSGTS